MAAQQTHLLASPGKKCWIPLLCRFFRSWAHSPGTSEMEIRLFLMSVWMTWGSASHWGRTLSTCEKNAVWGKVKSPVALQVIVLLSTFGTGLLSNPPTSVNPGRVSVVDSGEISATQTFRCKHTNHLQRLQHELGYFSSRNFLLAWSSQKKSIVKSRGLLVCTLPISAPTSRLSRLWHSKHVLHSIATCYFWPGNKKQDIYHMAKSSPLSVFIFLVI